MSDIPPLTRKEEDMVDDCVDDETSDDIQTCLQNSNYPVQMAIHNIYHELWEICFAATQDATPCQGYAAAFQAAYDNAQFTKGACIDAAKSDANQAENYNHCKGGMCAAKCPAPGSPVYKG
jgi:hypothetical protein